MAVILALLILAGLGAFVYLFSEKNPDDEQVAQSAYPGSAVTTPTPTPTPPSLTQLYEEELEKLEEIYPTGQPLHLPTTPSEEESTAEENEAVPTAIPSGTPAVPSGTPVTAGTPAEEQQEVSLYYYYSLLNEEEKAIYDQLLDGIEERSDLFDINVNDGVDHDRLNDITHYLYCDHPELFWFTGNTHYTDYGSRISMECEYSLTQDEIAIRQEEIAAATDLFLMTVDENLPDYDKIKAAYDYLCYNTVYQHSPDDQNIYSTLVNQETVCAGYARGMQFLLQQMNIPCAVITGMAGGDTHAWNAALCDNQWYGVDVTWGDSDYGMQEMSLSAPEELEVNYAFLLSDDEDFYTKQGRIPDEEFSGILPSCTDPSLKYYPNHGLYFENTEDVWEAIRAEMGEGDTVFTCQFANDELREAFLEEFSNGNRFGEIVRDTLGLQTFRTQYCTSENASVLDFWVTAA